MSDLNVRKGDSNPEWVNANADSDSQKVQDAKNRLSDSYVSTIIQSQQANQAEQTDQANAEAKNPTLLSPNSNASDPTQALNQLYSTQNYKDASEKLLWSMSKWEVPGATKEEQAQYANVKVTDPQVLQLAQKYNLPPGLVLKNMQTEYNFFFEGAVKNSLPPDQANQLIFAHYYPEYAPTLSPQLKSLLLKFQNDTNTVLNQKQGLPENWKPPTNNSEYAQTLSNAFSSNFEELLANQPQLSQNQVASLRTMFYMPEAQVPNADSLKDIFNALVKQATGEVQQQFGVPANFPLTVNTEGYNQLLLGAYISAFQQALNNRSPPLNADQKALIQKLIENPKLASSMPPEIQTLAEEIKSLSLAQIQDKFGLPKTWLPSSQKVTSNIDPKLLNMAQNAVKQMKEKYVKIAQMMGFTTTSQPEGEDANTVSKLVSSFSGVSDEQGDQSGDQTAGDKTAVVPLQRRTAFATAAPAASSSGGTTAAAAAPSAATGTLAGLMNGPEGVTYLDYLKTIGVAIQKVEDMIYKMQAASTSVAKQMSSAKLDMELNSLARQREQIEEMREKRSKSVDLGPLNDIMDGITKAMIIAMAIVLAPATGGLSLAIAVAYIVDTEQNHPSLFNQMLTHVQDYTTEAVSLILSDVLQQKSDSWLAKTSGILVNLSLVMALGCGNPVLMAGLLQEGRTVQSFVAMCGGGEMAQEITAASVQMLLQLICMIIAAIVTGGFSAPALVAPGLSTALGISQKAVMIVLKLLAISFEIIMASLQVTTKAISINNNILMAQIAMIKARQEALAEETAAMVQLLKKLIEKLLQILGGNADWLLDISNFQQLKYTKVSEITTELYS